MAVPVIRSFVHRAARPARAVVCLLLLVWAFLPRAGIQGRADAQSGGSTDVSVAARVPADAQPFINAAATGLATASVPTSPDVELGGTRDLRTNFLQGDGDLVVSGVPFTDGEKLVLAKSGRNVVAAPVQAVGLGLFGFVSPLPVFPEGCDEDDSCLARKETYTGPIRFTPTVLNQVLFERSNAWTEDDFISSLQLPAGRFFFPPIRGPRPLVRTDPDATNQYLEQYLAGTVPALHRTSRSELAGVDPAGAPTESWPSYVTPARLGMDNTVSQVREGLDPGSSEVSSGGTISAGSPSLVDESFELNARKPAAQRVPLFRVELQNAAGEWTLPSTASISAAVAAGEGIPNAGSVGLAVPGAYPITWVNSLYAPTTGLGAAKANAIAAIIRWQVTAGQASSVLTASEDGRLTNKMIVTALDAANQVVKSNCDEAKGTVETSADAGGTAPKGGFPGLGAVSWCKPPATASETPPTTAGDSSAATDSGSSASSDFSGDTGFLDSSSTDLGLTSADVPIDGVSTDPGASVLGESVTGDGGSSGSGGASSSGGGVPALQQSMPMALPGQTLPPLDRAATLGLGALAYVGITSFRKRRQ